MSWSYSLPIRQTDVNITSSITPPSLYLEAKIFIQICRFTFTLYRFYNPSYNKDFKFYPAFWFCPELNIIENIIHFVLVAWKAGSGNRLKPTN